MILTLLLTKGVALVEQTSSQVVRPALEGVAVLLGEEEEQGVLLVLEGELIILFDEINVDAEMYDFAARDASHLRTQHV